jgi:hypothetical protein
VRPNAGKMGPGHTPRLPFGRPVVPVAVCTRVCLAGRAEKEYSRQFGRHLGNPDSNALPKLEERLGQIEQDDDDRPYWRW